LVDRTRTCPRRQKRAFVIRRASWRAACLDGTWPSRVRATAARSLLGQACLDGRIDGAVGPWEDPTKRAQRLVLAPAFGATRTTPQPGSLSQAGQQRHQQVRTQQDLDQAHILTVPVADASALPRRQDRSYDRRKHEPRARTEAEPDVSPSPYRVADPGQEHTLGRGCPEVRGTSVAARSWSGCVDVLIMHRRCDSLRGFAFDGGA
jgi:hypothetical protein